MAFYRNSKEVVSIQGIEIEPHSLWEESKSDHYMLVLVDEDRYITHKKTNDFTSAL